MSSNKTLDVPQIVKKYMQKYPELDRDVLRKLIRLEFKITNPSELKKLDRCLGKAFEKKVEYPRKRGKEGNIEPSPKKQVSDEFKPRIEAYADAEWLAKQWKAFQPFDELFKIERRIRKEMGLET
jgi:hypothetical protein